MVGLPSGYGVGVSDGTSVAVETAVGAKVGVSLGGGVTVGVKVGGALPAPEPAGWTTMPKASHPLVAGSRLARMVTREPTIN